MVSNSDGLIERRIPIEYLRAKVNYIAAAYYNNPDPNYDNFLNREDAGSS